MGASAAPRSRGLSGDLQCAVPSDLLGVFERAFVCGEEDAVDHSFTVEGLGLGLGLFLSHDLLHLDAVEEVGLG